MSAPAWVCAGCGASPAEEAPFACPQAGAGDVDHVLRAAPPAAEALAAALADDAEPCPFVRFRALTPTYALARRLGLSDGDYAALVRGLDAAVARVWGSGFRTTPYRASERLGVWLKDETGNVSGSHKARHLMATAIHLALVEQTGVADVRGRELAIASCGNAALAAAVVARAAGRRLRVFIPPSANPAVVQRLRALEADCVVCARAPGDPPGDPCYRAFRAAVAAGALPFSCQGGDNALAIVGGLTLGWELARQHELTDSGPLRHLFIQVGGGALASGAIQALTSWAQLRGGALPHVHAVQTARVPTLARGFAAAAARAAEGSVEAALHHARTHRSEHMRPWPEEPQSVASGILDDEAYDWLAIVEGLLRSGGSLVLADEETLLRARALADEEPGIRTDPTGAAGLAGVLAARARGELPSGESTAVLITGARR